ncbi:hypothetical protein BU24DRAFT_427002 [Aaosphaeria arxii CBS 175.79]|uniref:Ubiquitin 3 binding protein But2 C-terminal domain-containing protein n=1 Tax=Aaosphaeria arxii CBS 175.79 TaxID=1450172 RepID=A0A6A5XD10_9PLEO|nr:uncharacterized protein BU24DRAFT_427002 [Aaosphaeria arxii CBS 175.79]KAF2010799.1 hypothetical protein BU24DRAFT_427002 [Aaosphaeria arxii CBS 175.79]
MYQLFNVQLLLLIIFQVSAATIILNSFTTSGPSCPPDSALTTAHIFPSSSNNGFNFTQRIDNFRPRLGPGVPITASRSNCTVTLNVTLSEPNTRIYLNLNGGYFSGYAPMIKGDTMQTVATYDWLDNPLHIRNSLILRGPNVGRFDRRGDTTDDNENYSPCNGGILTAVFYARLSTTSNEVRGEFPVDVEPEVERWGITTSMHEVPCRSTA